MPAPLKAGARWRHDRGFYASSAQAVPPLPDPSEEVEPGHLFILERNICMVFLVESGNPWNQQFSLT